MVAQETSDGLLSIGELSAASGISPHTLRVWERRYGRPEAVRLPSGHRRYPAGDAVWLRRIHELQAYGHRPSRLLALPAREFDALLAEARASRSAGDRSEPWLAIFREQGAEALRQRVQAALAEWGALRALEEGIATFVAAIGLAWEEGRLSIEQEHAITEVIEDLLRSERLRLVAATPPREASAARIALATLSGERHGLGLQMAALALAAGGASPLLLGVDLPADEIAAAARRAEAAAVGISVSLAHGGPEHGHHVQRLRESLPESVALLVGGLGARAACRGVRGVEVVADLAALQRWARRRRAGRG